MTARNELDKDGHGFVYYGNNTPAICICPVNDHQVCTYAFDNGKKLKMLLGIDECARGFMTVSKRMKSKNNDTLCLKSSGGLHSRNEVILEEWLWNPNKRQTASVGYPGLILNEYISVEIKNQFQIILTFKCDGIDLSFNVGLRYKRMDNYLDHAIKSPDGKLTPMIDRLSLSERQEMFSETMTAQRNSIKPKSENIETESFREVVARLEDNFDKIYMKFTSTSNIGTTWKSEAFQSTLDELPKIVSNGTESGLFRGFGEFLYTSSNNQLTLSKSNNFSSTASSQDLIKSKLLKPSGKWKTDLEIREYLVDSNPPLKRTAILTANSGQYSNMLIVNKRAISSGNPTGMVMAKRKIIPYTTWNRFKVEFSFNNFNNSYSHNSTTKSTNNVLLVVLLVQANDPDCLYSEHILELVNEYLHSANENALSEKDSYHFVKVDITDRESSGVLDELSINRSTLPIFVMINSNSKQILYSGSVGGRKPLLGQSISQSIIPQSSGGLAGKPQILIIENNIKQQIAMTKTVNKLKNQCDIYFCLSFQEAVDRIVHVMSGSTIGDKKGKDEVGINVKQSLPDIVIISDNLFQLGYHTYGNNVGNINTLVTRLFPKDYLINPTAKPVMSQLSLPLLVGISNLRQPKGNAYAATAVNDMIIGEQDQHGSVASWFSDELGKYVKYGVLRPLHPSVIPKLLLLKHSQQDQGFLKSNSLGMRSKLGLTKEILLSKIREVSGGSSSNIKASDGNKVGLKLSTEDIQVKGTLLVK